MQDTQIILSHMAQGLLYIDKTGTIKLVNEAAENILDVKKTEMLGKKFDEVFPDGQLGLTFQDVIDGRSVSPMRDIRYLTDKKVPEEKILEIDPSPVYSESVIDGMIILIRNITRLRQLEQIADRKSRLEDLGELASTIAHEIRNPLGGIKGFASLLLRDCQDDPKKLRMVENIVQGVDDLNRILSQLLDYTHTVGLELETTDINQLIKGVIEHIQADDAVKEKADIAFHPPGRPVMADVDPVQLKAALMNMILNSSQAIEDHGSITISLTETDINIRIEVEDTGPGIDKKIIGKIFRPFYSTKRGGSGFGLAESKKIIDSHLGEIKVSSCMGKGTKFIMTIPRRHEN